MLLLAPRLHLQAITLLKLTSFQCLLLPLRRSLLSGLRSQTTQSLLKETHSSNSQIMYSFLEMLASALRYSFGLATRTFLKFLSLLFNLWTYGIWLFLEIQESARRISGTSCCCSLLALVIQWSMKVLLCKDSCICLLLMVFSNQLVLLCMTSWWIPKPSTSLMVWSLLYWPLQRLFSFLHFGRRFGTSFPSTRATFDICQCGQEKRFSPVAPCYTLPFRMTW